MTTSKMLSIAQSLSSQPLSDATETVFAKVPTPSTVKNTSLLSTMVLTICTAVLQVSTLASGMPSKWDLAPWLYHTSHRMERKDSQVNVASTWNILSQTTMNWLLNILPQPTRRPSST